MRPAALSPRLEAAMVLVTSRAPWIVHPIPVPAEDAPATLADLKRRARRVDYFAPMAGWEIPVSQDHSDRTIWSSPAMNLRFRAWHDAVHVALDLPFDRHGERAACLFQIGQVAPWTTAADRRILDGEVYGLVAAFLDVGRFPDDQRAYVRAWAELGPDAALDALRSGELV